MLWTCNRGCLEKGASYRLQGPVDPRTPVGIASLTWERESGLGSNGSLVIRTNIIKRYGFTGTSRRSGAHSEVSRQQMNCEREQLRTQDSK
ncbi:hypothetical protein E5288_WYG009007 [Bos mutus]|uniref:Uncharacterized protein n=1 Tax=Bos mutus TaxID=72004 RepID=A0A6B0QWR2_9CETA|nr:hypothetical protein [Bos mutus]